MTKIQNLMRNIRSIRHDKNFKLKCLAAMPPSSTVLRRLRQRWVGDRKNEGIVQSNMRMLAFAAIY